jgi:hypothetical protein
VEYDRSYRFFGLPFLLKHIQKTTSNTKKTHLIIQLVTMNGELKQTKLPIMYCSRHLKERAIQHPGNKHQWRADSGAKSGKSAPIMGCTDAIL